MKNSKFTETYYVVIILTLVFLILWNIYSLLFKGINLALLPMGIEMAVLVLIILKNQYCKIVIKGWIILGIVIPSFVKAIAHFLRDLISLFDQGDLAI